MKTLWTLRKARPVCHWILCRVAAVFLWGAEASICQAQSSTPKPGGGTAPVQRGPPANRETVVHASAPITLQQLLEGYALATNLPPASGFGSGSGSASGGGGGTAATSGNSVFSGAGGSASAAGTVSGNGPQNLLGPAGGGGNPSTRGGGCGGGGICNGSCCGGACGGKKVSGGCGGGGLCKGSCTGGSCGGKKACPGYKREETFNTWSH